MYGCVMLKMSRGVRTQRFFPGALAECGWLRPCEWQGVRMSLPFQQLPWARTAKRIRNQKLWVLCIFDHFWWMWSPS